MAKINFYLLFNGNCEEAFNFYKSAFGIDFTFIGRYGDIPPQNGMPPISEDEKNKIENICLPKKKHLTNFCLCCIMNIQNENKVRGILLYKIQNR